MKSSNNVLQTSNLFKPQSDSSFSETSAVILKVPTTNNLNLLLDSPPVSYNSRARSNSHLFRRRNKLVDGLNSVDQEFMEIIRNKVVCSDRSMQESRSMSDRPSRRSRSKRSKASPVQEIAFQEDSEDYAFKDKTSNQIYVQHQLKKIMNETDFKNIPPPICALFTKLTELIIQQDVDKKKWRERLANRNT